MACFKIELLKDRKHKNKTLYNIIHNLKVVKNLYLSYYIDNKNQ